MYHFFVAPEQIGETSICITGSDVNHIKNVLRMKEGEKLLLGDGMSRNYLCELDSIENQQVTAKILAVDEEGSELPSRLYLFQGLPKSDKMELIIQKAVELGACQIIPVATKRAVVKLDGKKEEARIKRWNAISESAAKQSKRVLIPEVTGVMTLKEAFEYAKTFDLNIIPYENERGMEGTKEELSRIKPGMQVGIFIGPEGGFDEDEVAAAMERGIKPVTLGKRILRTETAGMAMLSILMFQLES